MHDLKYIRENPDAFDAGLARRGLEPRSAEILDLDKKARTFTATLNDLQSRRNATSKKIGAAKGQGNEEEAKRLMDEVDAIKTEMPTIEAEQKAVVDQVTRIVEGLPNLPAADVPSGDDEEANVDIRRWGEPREIEGAREHFDLGEALGQMDFETAAKMSGSRFVLLHGQLARLERALGNFMLDVQTLEFGYEEVVPPLLVKDDALFGTSQLPKFSDDLFRTTGDHWLIPTAEVSLTNIVRETILEEEELPKRFTAWTPCFRSEAGAAGRDTRGLIRMHQFSKVEMVSITAPEKSLEEHERMTSCAEAILQKLDLAYKTMTLCTGDMGFSAHKTYDLEVWLPGQKRYREISSCSNCGEFQARRMKARYRAKGEKSPKFVHTLNGSGLAVGRTLVAILENYQQEDGSIIVPPVLQPYMGGIEKIERMGG